jgi:hypothetical protein
LFQPVFKGFSEVLAELLNKLGWIGSILVSVALTLVLILAFRLFNG